MTGTALPTGRTGRLIAAGLTLLVATFLWWGIVSPLLDWYADRADALRQRAALLRHMDDLVATLPALQREAAAAPADDTARPDALLQAPSDATAGAALQQQIQDMAAKAGVALATIETLPGRQIGGLRQIALHVGTTASWDSLMHLLEAIDRADPRMVIDDLQLRSSIDLSRPRGLPIVASFSIVAFRAGEAP